MDKIYQVKYLSLLCTRKASSNVIFTCLGGESIASSLDSLQVRNPLRLRL